MTARSPPARPHIGIHPTSHFSSLDWGEDDAWDSASDSESPKQSTLSLAGSRKTAPRAVPKPAYNKSDSSSSTLAFSYTHVNAPNSSSYPPRTEEPAAPKTGWTIVRKSPSDKAIEKYHSSSQDDSYDNITSPEGQGDTDGESDMILGELECDPFGPETAKSTARKSYGRQRFNTRRHRSNFERYALLNDPLHGIRHRSRKNRSPSSPRIPREGPIETPEKSEKLMREKSIRSNRRHKFVECLSNQDVNIAELRKLAWAGIPDDLRPIAWQLLLGYLPLPTPLRTTTLARKREEYLSLVEVAFARDREGLDQQIWHQIEIDVPRTRPGVRLWMHAATQRSLERILYVWAIRHPASGYVQGINDLVTPFFQVFLSAYIDSNPEDFDPSVLPSQVLDAIEADSFWCLSRLLDGIQDNYIFAQPGIQRSVRRMAELVARIDAPLFAHLEAQNVEFMQFAFRWMNCLLMREISVQNTIRMWDTYLAEGPDAFSQFHLYVCSAFLVKWSDKLRQMDFQGIIMFLQSLPTQDWDDHEIEMLLSEAFVLNSIWHNAQSHFNGK
ncbi:rab-GTPase-TBC domain-containing protein [Armillaria novae-zelandiae]|uniref:Rab-GTPase-TBC domain-containing protein n=1 Tax=Armillaria novae-zelandiae TaxID=153914 RepID=A0AA39PKV4_9AGAR|nr:rab-GTPase-TBC domain-containing protein [Armillaria novae-zelandiae]